MARAGTTQAPNTRELVTKRRAVRLKYCVIEGASSRDDDRPSVPKGGVRDHGWPTEQSWPKMKDAKSKPGSLFASESWRSSGAQCSLAKSLSLLQQSSDHQRLGDLDGVRGRTFAQIVGDYPDPQAMRHRGIAAHAAHEYF